MKEDKTRVELVLKRVEDSLTDFQAYIDTLDKRSAMAKQATNVVSNLRKDLKTLQGIYTKEKYEKIKLSLFDQECSLSTPGKSG